MTRSPRQYLSREHSRGQAVPRPSDLSIIQLLVQDCFHDGQGTVERRHRVASGHRRRVVGDRHEPAVTEWKSLFVVKPRTPGMLEMTDWLFVASSGPTMMPFISSLCCPGFRHLLVLLQGVEWVFPLPHSMLFSLLRCAFKIFEDAFIHGIGCFIPCIVPFPAARA